ncbi:MAG: hypothetical protein JWN64_603 [Parcubacteria group bacterium]|nr:hypothetical protein [Parcubacteria group bacterium]
MLLALVFGAIFLLVLGALSSFVLSENKLQSSATAKSRGLAIAEAGLEYYRWFLAHNPNDVQNGTGVAGPYVIPYNDPEGGETGSISLAVTANTSCGLTTSIDIRSTGTPSENVNAKRTIAARYARPTVAQYSYILNDSVWAGSDRVISGPYHSNGGVRMDGTANSSVSSSLSTWLCTSSFGCSSNQTKAGVWGAGTNQTLWSYPTPQVDFAAISANFATLKTTATAQGLYFPRYSSGTSGVSANKGYHLIFNSNGTVTVYRVSNEYVTDIRAAVDGSDDTSDYARIKTEALYNTYTIPANCGLIYIEDNVWVEGTLNSKVTVVAANTITTGVAPNAYLPDNISYVATDGTDGLALIAENNILVTPDSPSTMSVKGIFIAQDGAFGRNLYDCPSSFEPKGTLTITGTTVSNKRTGTKWVNGCGSSDGGYQTRIDTYDRKLSTDPPAFTPYTSTDYSFVEWKEE